MNVKAVIFMHIDNTTSKLWLEAEFHILWQWIEGLGGRAND